MVILLFLYTFVLAFTLVRLPQIWHSFSGDFPQITDMHLHYNRGMYETCGGIGIERFVTRPRTNMCPRNIFAQIGLGGSPSRWPIFTVTMSAASAHDHF
jgi:hypothetical protein